MKKIIVIGIIIFIAGTQIASMVLHSNGIAGYTNSPGETTCTSCHNTYPLNSSGGNVTIKVPTCSNYNYVPGQTYTVNVKIARAGIYLFGFGFEAIDSTGANAGTLTLINSSTTILINALVNSNNRTNVTHYGGVVSNDSCVFSFKWTAPVTNVGKVSFYAAGNASNDDTFTYGDYIYTDSLFLTPSQNATIIEHTDYNTNLLVFINSSNETITLQYSLTDNYRNISAQLFSVNGTFVNTLFSEAQDKGQQRKEIRLPFISSKGIYFVRLFANNNPISTARVAIY